MLRNLNRQYAGRRVLDIGKTGVLGSVVPSAGTNGPSYLYGDVVANSWQSSEVRGRITSTSLPSGSWYAWTDGRLEIQPGTPDGTYTASFERFVFGVPQSTAGTITFNLGVAAGTLSGAITLSNVVFSGNAVGSGGIVQVALTLSNVTTNVSASGLLGTVSGDVVLSDVTASFSILGDTTSSLAGAITLDGVSSSIDVISVFAATDISIVLDNMVFTGSASGLGGSGGGSDNITLDDVDTYLSASGSYNVSVIGNNVGMPIPLGLTLDGKLIILA